MKHITSLLLVVITLFTSCTINPNYNAALPIGANTKHTCIDNTHEQCDGLCECDGMNCAYSLNSEFTKSILTRDYQLELDTDSILVYCGNRYVGSIQLTDDDAIGAMMYKDNE